ncbi:MULTISPECIES: hypothetical protein [unclassified Nocardioides]|jgi:hypothetical protein|uniref:hypothetical protein n=1 Tax=unclassified Nocardioides TaxID=2615069 RepID=UPI0011517E1A|nr:MULTISPECIES: hypothetical protein [unclassified Nocardioides]TQK69834.1 hypothetical protein FBY23_1600 [Nocardioides sp. SLBN-35]WGY00929.1 hypothetical protein QI633_20600 [Nocardioides sp. QY071]
MNAAYPQPRAAFQGHWMAPGTFGGVPAWLVVEDGRVALLAPGQSPTGFVDVFRVPVRQARISSAAQRITVTVAGTAYPVLARPHGPVVGSGLAATGSVAGLAGAEVVHGTSTAARAGNVAADAAAFARQGGPQFLATLRQQGGQVRRVGYGVLLSVGFVAGLLLALLVTVITVAVLA